jgi:hypothetical protein
VWDGKTKEWGGFMTLVHLAADWTQLKHLQVSNNNIAKESQVQGNGTPLVKLCYYKFGMKEPTLSM